MTQDEIIEMAKQAGFLTNEIKSYVISPYTFEDQDLYEELEAFAKLVAAKEREAWRNAAIRVGENLATCGPAGYYDFTAQQWLDWALDATTKMQDDYMNLGACGEREACAKAIDEVGMFHEVSQGADLCFDLSKAIRTRGEA